MHTTRRVTLAIVAVLAVVVTWLIASGRGEDHPVRTTPASSPTAARTPRPGAPHATRARPTTTNAPVSPSARTGRPPSPRSTAPTQRPDASATAAPGGASSTPPETASPTRASSATPPPESASPSPTAATAQGRLVEGFPALLAPPPGSAIERSSVSSNDGDQQATLVLSGDPHSALRYYRGVLRARGYVEESRRIDDHLSTAFMRDEDTVVLTTIDAKTYLVADLHEGSG